jgi:hypothetical protein
MKQTPLQKHRLANSNGVIESHSPTSITPNPAASTGFSMFIETKVGYRKRESRNWDPRALPRSDPAT